MSRLMQHNQTEDGVLTIMLHDPKSRNALGLSMFDAIDQALQQCNDETRCVLLGGGGACFCSGFEMRACAEDITILQTYITRLSTLVRSLRRLPVPVVVAAHGAAIAGGCAILTGCDFIVGSKEGKYGYPVHQLGISPAVTIPTLYQRLGQGRARALLMGGEVIGGEEAYVIGVLTHLCNRDEDVLGVALELAEHIASKPPHVMRTTKQWLNELDGSLEDDLFDPPAEQSASAIGDETISMLKSVWDS